MACYSAAQPPMGASMTAVKTASDRIPVADLEAIIARALVPGDYEHDTEWARPDSCPCHDQGLQRCTQYAGIRGSCQGYPAEIDTPAEHVVTAEILTSALPEPDNEGTLDSQEAALSILSVIGERLSYPYTLRRDHLVKRLTEEAEEYELAHGLADTGVPQDAGQQSWMPKCQYCGEPCKDKRARYCRPSHRQQAYKRRKRDGG
jgi:hypothetical protein